MKGPVFARARARRQAELAVCRVGGASKGEKGGGTGEADAKEQGQQGRRRAPA